MGRRMFGWLLALAVVAAGAAGPLEAGGDKGEKGDKGDKEKEPVGKLLEKQYESETGAKTKVDYLLLLPADYGKDDKPAPLLLFLHGKGDKLERMKKGGLPRQLERKKDFPCIVVAPEAPGGGGWDARMLNGLLDEIVTKYKVDKDRVYVTGLSMGGFGTWSLAAAYPDRFAAIIPICGGGNPGSAKKIKDLPIWVFHGAKDTTVPPARSEAMVKALKDAGAANVQFTLYPDAAHDAWSATYRNQEVWDWLLKQKRGGAKEKEKDKESK